MPFMHVYVLKKVILPRQARDKHRESSTQKRRLNRFLAGEEQAVPFGALWPPPDGWCASKREKETHTTLLRLLLIFFRVLFCCALRISRDEKEKQIFCRDRLGTCREENLNKKAAAGFLFVCLRRVGYEKGHLSAKQDAVSGLPIKLSAPR